MKKQGVFPGILLIGIGLYFLLDELQITLFNQFYSWPTIMIIIGVAFLASSYFSNDHQKIFPGVILLGLGVHFHAVRLLAFWPDHWAMYTFIIGLAFIISYRKSKKNGIIPGIILVLLSAIALFYDGLVGWLGWLGQLIDTVERFWPAVLIVIGIYILFFKKK